MKRPHRDYTPIVASIEARSDARSAMRAVVDATWTHLCDKGVSWVGFYIDQPDESDDRRFSLGPCRDKPACSPIGLHGVCGQALLSKQVQIVRDVMELGANYIACDPADRSELVVPLLDVRGECWAVFDVDSRDIDAFDQSDATAFSHILARAGLIDAAGA